MKKHMVVFVFGCCLAAGMWSNPFIGNKKTPTPIRTEQTPDFIIRHQAQLHTKLGDYIYEWTQTNSLQAFWTIIAAAFFYGCIHALGPGHRKALVFSFYLSKKAPVWEPAVTSLILAGLHGITSIVLLLIFRNVGGALSVQTESATIYLEGFSFILLLLLSAASILHLLAHAFPNRFPHFRIGRSKATQKPQQAARLRTMQTADGVSHAPQQLHPAAGLSHEYGYGTLYKHTLRNAVQPRPTAGTVQWGVFLLSGIYPCPAALLVLALVSTLDAVGVGIAAIISMSVGMAIPITAAAYLAWNGRKRLFKRISKTQRYLEAAALLFGFAAYGTIFIVSLITVLPFLKGLIARL